jgi:hypothetical protein
MHHIQLHIISCITFYSIYNMHFILLHFMTCISYNYKYLHALQTTTDIGMHYILFHIIQICSAPVLEHEPQKCLRNPGASGFGRVNLETWFEAAQYRANQLEAAAGGREFKCAVAGMVWFSNA